MRLRTPDTQFKLLLSLAQYLGLRIPSEAFWLTWDRIDWERGRMRVPSPKTEVKATASFRILPEVRLHLEAVYDQAPEGATFVLESLRNRESVQTAERGFWANLNLRKRMLCLLERAGVQPWPKLFHNLRASAQTDLAARFPSSATGWATPRPSPRSTTRR